MRFLLVCFGSVLASSAMAEARKGAKAKKENSWKTANRPCLFCQIEVADSPSRVLCPGAECRHHLHLHRRCRYIYIHMWTSLYRTYIDTCIEEKRACSLPNNLNSINTCVCSCSCGLWSTYMGSKVVPTAARHDTSNTTSLAPSCLTCKCRRGISRRKTRRCESLQICRPLLMDAQRRL